MPNFKPPLYAFALLPILAGCSDPVDPADRKPAELRFETNQISGFVGDSIEVSVVLTDSRGRTRQG